MKAGDTWAFQYLVNKYKDEALSLACSLVKDPHLAEDVLQEVFIKVFDKISSFKYQSAFYTWLYRMVVNRCYNELRKKKYTTNELEAVTSGQEETTRAIQLDDTKMMVNSALRRMKPDEALVLRLFYLSELSVEEVIEVTAFSKSKVKVTLHRGRKSFAEMMNKQFGKEIADL